MSPSIDQRYAENYDECCAMLRRVEPGDVFLWH